MNSQRDTVRASLLVQAAVETHRDVYSTRRPRLRRDPVSVGAVSGSIRDLGVLLNDAETDRSRAWLSLRLRNRLDLLDVLIRRGGQL